MPKDLDKDEAAKLERLAKESAAGMLAEIEKDKKNPKKIMSNEEFDDLIKSVPASLGDRRDEPCPFCGEGPQGFCECDDSLDTYKQLLRQAGKEPPKKEKKPVPDKATLRRTDIPKVNRRFSKPPVEEVKEEPKPEVKVEEKVIETPVEPQKTLQVASQTPALRRKRYNLTEMLEKVEDSHTKAKELPPIVEKKVEKPRIQQPREEIPEVDEIATHVEALIDKPGWPTLEQTNSWKAKYGKIFYIALETDEIYFYRRLLNYEEAEIRRSITSQDEDLRGVEYNEAIIRRCVLFPDLTDSLKIKDLPAGVVPTLINAIMSSSHYIDVSAAMRLVRKL